MKRYAQLENIAKTLRYYILTTTTKAGSGHPTTSMSATDLMTVLFFGGYLKFDIKKPKNPLNDRIIFSKGHASPLFYPLWAVAGGIPFKELDTLREFGSRLEGHPTMEFPFTEAPTGSLGQGLSIGVGIALNGKYIEKVPYKTYVLLGDSEMAEGSVWEALQSASHYKLNNLIAILDVNRLGQSGETMVGHDTEKYAKRIKAFGWNVVVINGHSLKEIDSALKKAQKSSLPCMIVAKTVKGKGVSFIANKNGWHGKALDQEQLEMALKELGSVDKTLKSLLLKPAPIKLLPIKRNKVTPPKYVKGEKFATRKAYGQMLEHLAGKYPDIVVLDAETSNSTYSEFVKNSNPDVFFEMYIAEQNMAGVAEGFATRGKVPFASTFAAFWSRAHDQIRMAQYANTHIVYVGSHAGVSIGQDGASQMALEDLGMFRSLHGSTVLYPSDAVSTVALVEKAYKAEGLVYIRTTRAEGATLYGPDEKFEIGGSKTVVSSSKDVATVIGAGITLHEALKAYEELKKKKIMIRVIDLYSIKPIDVKTIQKALKETKGLIIVEDHYPEGGISEAVKGVLQQYSKPIISLAVKKIPRSGMPEELLNYEEISSRSIIKAVKSL